MPSNFLYDEFAVLLIDGSAFDWVNDTVMASLYSDAYTPAEADVYTGISAFLVGQETMANRSVDATGIAAGDGMTFLSVTFPGVEEFAGLVLYRDDGGGNYTMIMNISQGTDAFDGLEGFGVAMAGSTVIITPNATNNGWFRA
tara:strand:- start:6518 stop:6946 length:429 start_codon:yes stop_codon:yes gene_type:complete